VGTVTVATGLGTGAVGRGVVADGLGVGVVRRQATDALATDGSRSSDGGRRRASPVARGCRTSN
jgi:hypothetical protein